MTGGVTNDRSVVLEDAKTDASHPRWNNQTAGLSGDRQNSGERPVSGWGQMRDVPRGGGSRAVADEDRIRARVLNGQNPPGMRMAASGQPPEGSVSIPERRSSQPGSPPPGRGANEKTPASPCPAVAYAFTDDKAYREAYADGFIPKGEAYYAGKDGNTVHFAGSTKTVSRDEYYRGASAAAHPAPEERSPSGGQPGPEAIRARIASWGREMEVRAARESSPFTRRGFLFSKAGRAMMGMTEPVYGANQMLSSGVRWVTSAGGYFPNSLSRAAGAWEQSADSAAARLDHTQQIAREAAGLRNGQWDWWSIAGAAGSPANWIPAGRAVKGLKWGAEYLPAASRWAVNNVFTRGMTGGAVFGALKPTAPGEGETHAGIRLENAAAGAAWGLVLGPVIEYAVAPVVQRIAGKGAEPVSGGKQKSGPEGGGEKGGPEPVVEGRSVEKPHATLNGQRVEPQIIDTDLYHGTRMTWAEVVEGGGMPAEGTNIDLLNHVNQGGNSAFRGTTRMAATPDGQGAAAWAGEGGLVLKIDGLKVPGYDVNKLMEGRIARPQGDFTGNLWSGEQEIAVHARVPLSTIREYGTVEILESGRPRVNWEPNPHYEP